MTPAQMAHVELDPFELNICLMEAWHYEDRIDTLPPALAERLRAVMQYPDMGEFFRARWPLAVLPDAQRVILQVEPTEELASLLWDCRSYELGEERAGGLTPMDA